MHRIGIIGAMEEEIASLKEKMEQVTCKKNFRRGSSGENRWWLYVPESGK